MTTALPLRRHGPVRRSDRGRPASTACCSPRRGARRTRRRPSATLAAPGLELSTGVAVAFPRSPMITAQAAWELQEATGGSFRLGLGTQVRTHVVRRYGVEFERPGPRLRDYVLAVKACFAGFRGRTARPSRRVLRADVPQRRSGARGRSSQPDPKVDIAAVNPWMLRMAGEVADGVHVHPIGEPGYLARHVLPSLADGAAEAGRDVDDVTVIVPVLTIVGDTDEEIARGRDAVAPVAVVLRVDAELRLHLGRSRVRGHDRSDPGEAEGRRLRRHGRRDQRRASRRVRHRVDAGTRSPAISSPSTAAWSTAWCSTTPAGDTPERFERYGAVAKAISDAG